MKYQKLLQQLNDLYRCPVCNLYLDIETDDKICRQKSREVFISTNYARIDYHRYTIDIYLNIIRIVYTGTYVEIISFNNIDFDNIDQLFQQLETIINFS